jgi:hypothetical protein
VYYRTFGGSDVAGMHHTKKREISILLMVLKHSLQTVYGDYYVVAAKKLVLSLEIRDKYVFDG